MPCLRCKVARPTWRPDSGRPGHRRCCGRTVAAGRASHTTVVDKHFQEPYVESWNLVHPACAAKEFSLEVAYVGNHGVKIPMAYNLNAP